MSVLHILCADDEGHSLRLTERVPIWKLNLPEGMLQRKCAIPKDDTPEVALICGLTLSQQNVYVARSVFSMWRYIAGHFYANKAKTGVRHFCLKHCGTRCTPVKRDR